jgi:hypothetical protein
VSSFRSRTERAFLGLIMTVLAFIVERRVNRALRRSG